MGASWLPDDGRLPEYEAAVTELRQQTNCWGEFKWEKVDPAWIDPYQRFLRLSLALPRLKFTSMVIDTRLLTPDEMKRYHPEGGRPEAYLKFMRLLLKERIKRFVSQGHRDFTLLYDKLSVERKLARGFRDVLSQDMENLRAAKGTECRFVHLSPVNSATVHLMQATDLLTGATRAAWEKRHDTSGKKAARQAVTEQIVAWAGGDLTDAGFSSTRYYNLWKWRPPHKG